MDILLSATNGWDALIAYVMFGTIAVIFIFGP